ncbi:hypothetical protein BCR34DRAFT_301712 [Clohesyomyces aquaticus]|uniref:Zn(2)-C6 fungal-type domain-containing protein n=1 Tax=Clohesyomyces aquaticus TaxID=1231657 RepID=A0A1Y1ZQK4_9PLEO|nr:hypothetical protein BCR34DRAFT_301712 [Clohesyomyces aquaticus]
MSTTLKSMAPTSSIIEFPNLKKTRRYGAKVKTGCRTCKLRHVRCDESKPNCVRCTSTGRKCDGYAQDEAPKFTSLRLNQVSLFQYTTSTPGNGAYYLEFYHHYVGCKLSTGFGKDFWSRTALQMARSEASVRYALVALSYLYKTEFLERGSLKHARSGLSRNTQPDALLFHYNKAIGCLVDRMAEASYSPEVGLVTCLLFICIEFMRGDHRTSFSHLRSGLKLISEWHSKRLNTSSDQSTTLKFSLTISNDTRGSNSMIADHLLPVFIQTIPSALLYGVRMEDIFEIPIPRVYTYQVNPFATFLEAQASFHELEIPTIQFLTAMATKLSLRYPITAHDLHCQSQLFQCLQAWFQSLQILENKRMESQENKRLASSLKVVYHSTYVALACALEIRQGLYDAYIADFKALIHHAKIVLGYMGLVAPSPLPPSDDEAPLRATEGMIATSSPRVAANFTFEISLIPCLQVVATRCRCPVTRREALALLALNPPREALWDAEMHLVIAKRVIEIEEKVLDPGTGWPAESSRLWCAVIDGDHTMGRDGSFRVRFAFAKWMQEASVEELLKRRKPDAQWEEWFVV